MTPTVRKRPSAVVVTCVVATVHVRVQVGVAACQIRSYTAPALSGRAAGEERDTGCPLTSFVQRGFRDREVRLCPNFRP